MTCGRLSLSISGVSVEGHLHHYHKIIPYSRLKLRPGVNEEIEKENLAASSATLSDILDGVISDVAPPSPVADMPEAGESSGRVETPASPTPLSPGERRGRGRPKKAGGDSPSAKPSATPRPKLEGVNQNPGLSASKPQNFDQAGIEPCAQMCIMAVNVSGMMLGGEAAAMRENEILLAKSGFVEYFKIKGISNIPPSIMLLGALMPYYIRIMTTTPAKTTLANFTGRAWFRIKEIWKEKKNARSNRRNNVKRENDTSSQAGEQSQ